jgi:diaminopimelate decarboxylase
MEKGKDWKKITKEKRMLAVKKTPFTTKEKLEEIIKEIPTPFHIYDEKGMRENAKAVRDAFAWNPGFKEYFAVKANPNPVLMQILQEYGCGVDCSSLTELMLSDAAGFHGHDIMFSSNDTPAEEFVYADKLGAIINLDDFTHVQFLEDTLGYIPETISCRFNPGGVYEVSNGIMDNPGDAKYGMTKEQIIEAYKILKQKGAKHFGIHAFLVSNTVTNDYYPSLAKTLFELVVEISKETGCKFDFINLSGGVGIPYRPDQTPNDIFAIGEGVHKVYDEILVPAGLGDVKIFTEMGRFMMGPYGALVTKAIHEKHTYKEYIGVDACAANLMRPAMYGAYHHITVMGKENSPCDHKYDVTGSLCENNDKFAVDRMLPEIEKGDILFIHDTGAHGSSMGYNYNGRLWSAEVLLKEDGSYELIRRAQTPRDYFSTLDCFPIYKEIDFDLKK